MTRRFQFSLSTLLLFVVIVSLAMSLGITYYKLVQVSAENQDYRNRYGHLTISDPKKIHAIQVPTNEGNAWRWRVYLPEGRKYRLCYHVSDIPVGGFPKNRCGCDHRAGLGLPPGEHTIAVNVTKDLQGEHVLRLQSMDCCTTTAIVSLEGEKGDWLDDETGQIVTMTSGNKETTSTEPDEPLSLIRLRCVKPVKNASTSAGRVVYKGSGANKMVYPLTGPQAVPSDGFLIWIQDPDLPSTPKQKTIKTP